MSILVFLVIFTLTILLQRWLHQHIQAFVIMLTGNSGWALRLLFYLLLPGILLHEASHYVAAKLLLVRTGKVTIGIRNLNSSRSSLGSVTIDRTDPVRESLIGVAPFLVGVGAIWALMGWGFDLWAHSGVTFELFFQRVGQYANDWTTWLDLYLVFAVSTAMIPSESDREPWGPVITFFGAGVALLFILGWTPRVPPDAVTLARNLLDALTFALGIAVIVNGGMAGALWLLEQMLARIKSSPVEYRMKTKRGRR